MQAASDVANKASAGAAKAGEAVGASQAGAADASRKAAGLSMFTLFMLFYLTRLKPCPCCCCSLGAIDNVTLLHPEKLLLQGFVSANATWNLAGAASGLGQKARDAAAGAGQKVQSAAGDAKGAAAEYAGKAQSAAGEAKGVAAEYAGKAQSAASGAASGARDAAAAAGQRASGTAAGVAGAAAMPAGGVPLWAYAALGIAGGAVAYYSFKASPGSPGAPRPSWPYEGFAHMHFAGHGTIRDDHRPLEVSCCCARCHQAGRAFVCTCVFWHVEALGLCCCGPARRGQQPLSTPDAKLSMRSTKCCSSQHPARLRLTGL